MQSTLRQRLLASTLLIGAAGFATPAFAQPVDEDVQENSVTATIDEDSGEGTEAIVVTGSRIQRRDLVSSSPLAVVQDEEFKLSGAVNVEQVINTLPQVLPGATSFSNNPGGGVATLNLRGLGAQRTLVLVNGRRYLFFDTSQVVDLNTIPQFLIDSVDIVTGGASAVYGSDALGGVVNFRLQTDLQGIVAGSQISITEEGDGARFNAYVAMGNEFADGRGHVTVFGEYFKRKPIFQDDREFSIFALTDGDGELIPGGSGATGEARVLVPTSSTIPGNDANGDGDFTDPGDRPEQVFDRGAGTVFNQGTLGGIFFGGQARAFQQTDTYNYAPANYLQVPQERFLLGGYGEYEISEAITAFTEVTFINNRVRNELAATPITGTTNINIDAVAPFISDADEATFREIDANEAAINAARVAAGLTPNLPGAGVISASVNRRTLETGPRNSFDERNAFRALAGIKGPINDAFNYEAYYFYSRTRNANVQEGNISRSAFNRGLDGTDPAINIFGTGTLSQASVDQITILAQNNDISVLQVANAAISGSLFNFGLGAEDIGIAAGVEYRKVASQFIPDTALSSGDVVGFNAGNPTQGGYDVREGFVELRIPIIADRPFFERLEVTGAARYSDYSLENVGGVYTYAVGAEYAPIPDITFRGNYQRAIRAPNVGELFSGGGNGFPLATDPCATAGAQNNATLRALCIASGVPASAVGSGLALQPNPQIEASFGGNPDLQEETSDSYTFGAVFRPRFIPRLNVTIDYFDIKIDQLIATAGGGANNILNLCYNVIQDLSSPVCQLINRDPNTGIIGGDFLIQAGTANLASAETSGVDLQVDYSQPLNFGLMGETSKLNFFFLGTYTRRNNFTPVVGVDDVIRCADKFGVDCGNPQPSFKWTSRLSLIDGPMTASVRWRHLSNTTDDDDSTDYVVESIGAYDLIDLAFSFDLTDQFTMALGVNNLFDKQPPILGDNQEQANTFPGTFDPLGRDYFVSASFRF